ncbi:ATP-binding protein [Actinoplanes sp. NPDC051470]|uniref:hybrid sensor histidine kinase/response regulator n=1 Tax=Actinoplanes sp. NPDC051470 TaxID=3157224 RepID=UPI00341BF3FE
MVEVAEAAHHVGRTELAAIVACTHDAVIGVTPPDVVNSCNPAAAALYGRPAEQIIGRHLDDLVAPDRRTGDAEILRRVLRGGQTEQYDTAWLGKDDRVIAVSLTASAVIDTAGDQAGAVLVCREQDTPPAEAYPPAETVDRGPQAGTDQATLDAQMQQTQRLEVLGRLAGGVAHDFNNLLAVILNYAAFVAEELTSAPAWEQRQQTQHDVGQIQQAAERAAELTHQLLAFARQDVIRPQVLHLNDNVSRVEELLRRTLGEDVELTTTLAPDLWPILADPGQIEQILLNLAINARDAMPHGGTLRIDTTNIVVDDDSVAAGSPARPGHHVQLRVSDTGTGIPADVLNHVFEPFFTTKSHNGGTGLGLATVYGIVTQAEGAIGIQSEAGAGTTFTITLPITDQAATLEEPDSYRRTPAGETILVVEDQEALRQVTERILTRNGYKVITAANGPDALALAAGHDGDIHLLVTDVVMPKMLGKEVAERIREFQPDIEVLYMSGYAQPVLASQGKLDRGVALLDKPFSEDALITKAGLVLNAHFHGYETIGPDKLRHPLA